MLLWLPLCQSVIGIIPYSKQNDNFDEVFKWAQGATNSIGESYF